MKGLSNSKGKLMRLEKKVFIVDDEKPTVYPDTISLDDLKEDTEGLKLVDLDVTIEKPKPTYSVAK